MSDSDNTIALDMPADELALLKQRADMLGITYSPKIGVDSLKEKIERKLAEPAGNADGAAAEPASDASPAVQELRLGRSHGPNRVLTEGQRKARIRRRMKEEEMKLVRLRINCLNPNKRTLQGEIITVANKYLGIVKKFVPYGEASEEGFHVPNVLYKQLKDRKFLDVKTTRDKRTGRIKITQRWVPEFALEVLPPLTEAELKQLAAAQAAAGGLD